MNKGLELIESGLSVPSRRRISRSGSTRSRLYNSMVAYSDGSMLAQLGTAGYARADCPCAGLASRMTTPGRALDLGSDRVISELWRPPVQ